MSRSYKKVPIRGVAGGNSAQKKFKQQEHRKERRAINQAVDLENTPHFKQFGNKWASPRDGKMWFGKCIHTFPEDYPKWMRK